MPALKFAENYYSSRSGVSAFAITRQPATPEQLAQQAALQAIEAKMNDAHTQFVARRYEAAIDAYNDASDMIHAQLVPNFPVGISRHRLAKALPAELFDSMLSTGLEWMNVLPVRQPEISARPRVDADAQLLGESARFGQLGVQSGQLTSPKAANALADWQLARGYAAQGNQPQAAVFNESARRLAPDVVALLEQGNQRGFEASASGTVLPPALMAKQRVLGTMVRGDVAQFAWNAGEAPPLQDLKSRIYEERIALNVLGDLFIPAIDPTSIALNLPHYYYYVIPLGLAECHHAIGDYARAEQFYFQAAAYQFLNTAIEAPYVWQCLASLYLDWGNSLFRQDEVADARDIYERLLTLDAAVPVSGLYTTAALRPGADIGRAVITDLALFLARVDDPATVVPDLNPVIVADILEVHQHLLKIAAGLDFWGHWHQSVPIWTFDYLQSVAINFTQFAIGAERDFISFQAHADESALTRQQLVQGMSQANAEVNAATLAAQAASAEVEVYNIGASLADLRAQDAKDNAEAYAAMSADQIVRQAVATQMGGGDDGDRNDLNYRADTLMGIGPTAQYIREHPGNWRMEGSAATMSATEQLVAARLNRQYEVDTLNRQAAEMAVAGSQAKAELNVAKARAAAARAGVAVAQVRTAGARQNLAAFDNQFFTPEVWRRMGDTMLHLYHRYFNMALRAARLMQQAYNFETDQALHMIKTDYAVNEVKGLLGADVLMADIQGFTYNLITSAVGKPQPVRQTISLAERYGFIFENQFRRTGIMEFETDIDDFDAVYPGTYAGRIESVEVEVLGIVPAIGISGTLTNNGISAYRTPASLWVDPAGTGLKYRVQSRETLVLSDYFPRQDALLVPHDARMTKIFQGAGLASTWRLELPKAINDIDYGALTDVRLTFYYKVRFDPDLHDRVLAQLAARPGVHARQRGIPLRWIYPDAFFHFQDSGELRIKLRASDFRYNEKLPQLTDVGVLVVTDDSISAAGLKVALSTPGHPAPILASTDAQGAIPAGDPAWAALTGGSALGDYIITLPDADNPVLTGPAKRAPIVNIALILGYSFTPAS
jgi:tetratricopeptide (TPR) repeat protein